MMAMGNRLPGLSGGGYHMRGMGDAASRAWASAREEWSKVLPIADAAIREIDGILSDVKDKRDEYNNYSYRVIEECVSLDCGYEGETIAKKMVNLGNSVGELPDPWENTYQELKRKYIGWKAMKDGWHTAQTDPMRPAGTQGWGGWVGSMFQSLQSEASIIESQFRDFDSEFEALERSFRQIKDSREREAKEMADAILEADRIEKDRLASIDERNRQIAADAKIAADIERLRIEAQQAAGLAARKISAEERALALELERERLAREDALQKQLFALKKQEIDRQYEREREAREGRDQLALVLQLMDKGLIAPGQVEVEGIGPLGVPEQQQPYGYGSTYQGGAVPAGYQLIDDSTGQPVNMPGYPAYPGGGGYNPYAPPAPQVPGWGYPGTQSYGPPQQYQQPAPVPAPPPVVQPAPQQAPGPVYSGLPGIEYGPFTPGAELFGGELDGAGLGNSAGNLPAGAYVAPGYRMFPEGNNWKVITPEGKEWTMSNAQVQQPGMELYDPDTKVTYYRVPQEESVGDSIVGFFNKITPTGLTAGEAYLRAKRGESILPQQAPTGGGGGRGMGSLVVGGLVLGGIGIAAFSFLKRKK
jgi:hypothetical protein